MQLACCHRRSARAHEERPADDYDLEYDRGRVKKVRSRDRGSDQDGDGEGDSNRFQAAWAERSRGGRHGSSHSGRGRGVPACIPSRVLIPGL